MNYEDVEVDKIGHAASETPAYDLTDTEVLEYQEQARQRARRRIPCGFQSEYSAAYWLGGREPGTFPKVPHFDEVPDV